MIIEREYTKLYHKFKDDVRHTQGIIIWVPLDLITGLGKELFQLPRESFASCFGCKAP